MSDYLTVSLVSKDQKHPDKKPRWSKVGAAFPNKLGGYNIVLDHSICIVPGVTDLVIATPLQKDGGQSSGSDQPF